MPKTALALMRTQPLHKGHCWIINEMLQSAETVIIGLGSCDKAGTRSNPFNGEQRIQMIKNVYGTRVKCLPLNDLGSTPDKSEWIDYVLGKIHALGLPDPTEYYTGSPADAIWYDERFWSETTSRLTLDQVTAHNARNEPYGKRYYTPDERRVRKLHIMDRASKVFPITATELRAYIELRSEQWKKWVPEVNHELVQQFYPAEFLVG